MNNQQDSEQFTVLENKKIGRNLAMFRRLRNKKAFEVADYIGIGEPAYTKYERGEAKITVDFVQKVSEFLNIDPITLLSETPSSYIDNHGNNTNSFTQGDFYYHGTDKEVLATMLKLMENMMTLSQKLIEQMDKDK